MMVHCTVVHPFIDIVGSIEMQSSERTEPQGDCSWVELWAAGRGGCCCCIRDLAELPGAAGPWVPEPRCSRSTRTAGRMDPCSLVSMSRLVSPRRRGRQMWEILTVEKGARSACTQAIFKHCVSLLHHSFGTYQGTS